ncbi:hypothetical protein OBBRIDRAFT_883341 [Obba rivulosa]|uniref:Uncharacterized protein n=1 Tax=Obba rivulosa TaxID=1052685 RepID=A0A8E2J6V3_9APHY|nr:hypothetical protein OBBRIDRAFT_883341 [Obba rivulosa]
MDEVVPSSQESERYSQSICESVHDGDALRHELPEDDRFLASQERKRDEEDGEFVPSGTQESSSTEHSSSQASSQATYSQVAYSQVAENGDDIGASQGSVDSNTSQDSNTPTTDPFTRITAFLNSGLDIQKLRRISSYREDMAGTGVDMQFRLGAIKTLFNISLEDAQSAWMLCGIAFVDQMTDKELMEKIGACWACNRKL